MAEQEDLDKTLSTDNKKEKLLKLLFSKAIVNAVLILLVISMLITVLNAYEVFYTSNIDNVIGVNLNETALKEFPVIIKNEQVSDFASFSNNLAVLTKSNIIIYNNNGKKINTILHGYTNPVIKESPQRILTYDRGGGKLRVDTENTKIGDLTFSNSIITAELSQTGELVVITSSDRYACEIQVYDNTLRNITYRYLSTEVITSVSFSSDKKFLIGNSITSHNGILSCNLYQLDITTGDDAEIIFINDILPLNVAYGEKNTVKILGSDCIVTVDLDTGKQSSYVYKGNLQHYFNSPTGETILINKSMYSNYSTITIISPTGEIAATRDITNEILDVYCNGSRIAILCKGEIYDLSMSLTLLNEFALKKTMKNIVYGNSNLYALGVSTIEEFIC